MKVKKKKKFFNKISNIIAKKKRILVAIYGNFSSKAQNLNAGNFHWICAQKNYIFFSFSKFHFGLQFLLSIEVPARTQLTISQEYNNFDSVHQLSVGPTCPGTTVIFCNDYYVTLFSMWTTEISHKTCDFKLVLTFWGVATWSSYSLLAPLLDPCRKPVITFFLLVGYCRKMFW